MKTNYQNAGMLDMIFENRNKSYGAYALRNNYNSRISQALLITFSSVVLLCFGKLLSDKLKNSPQSLTEPVVTLDPIPEVHLEDEVKIEPEPQKPPQAQAINTMQNTEMHVTVDNHVMDSVPTNEQMQDIDPGLTTNLNTGNTIGVTDGQGTQPTFEVALSTPAPEPVRDWAEVMPEFPGGEKALMKFLQSKTVYPDRERDLEIEGKALIKFVVNEDGSISNVSVAKTESSGFGKEGVRVASMLPKFKPGMQQGRTVRVQYVLPFHFKLSH